MITRSLYGTAYTTYLDDDTHYPGVCHNCEIISTSGGHHMIPNYVLQLVLLGGGVLFAVLVIGFLIVVDRARLTPVIRARLQDQPNVITVEEILTKALNVYNELNSN